MDILSCPALVRKDAKRSVKTSSKSVRPIKGLASIACSFRRVLVHIITVKVLKSEEQTRPDLRIAHTVR